MVGALLDYLGQPKGRKQRPCFVLLVEVVSSITKGLAGIGIMWDEYYSEMFLTILRSNECFKNHISTLKNHILDHQTTLKTKS